MIFSLGGVLAYGLAGSRGRRPCFFAAGNFLYAAVADLFPEIATSPIPRGNILSTMSFAVGLVTLVAIARAVRPASPPRPKQTTPSTIVRDGCLAGLVRWAVRPYRSRSHRYRPEGDTQPGKQEGEYP
ncbi:hypothetical protein CBI38_09580 [Rhodococcus oxybenzonivorans]|uniref:Uncharacterized protein n=1 Tax=Rhodococcus oxybenzonivorans TaxID=1990687 RepID=A0A2S2BT50_9NOCA|nr:hypothetical protein CBI38_09580 [Rhodococcus oxybenzonivorans]